MLDSYVNKILTIYCARLATGSKYTAASQGENEGFYECYFVFKT